MPEGMLPEVFIVIGLVALVGVIGLVARRRPGRDTDVIDRPEEVEAPEREDTAVAGDSALEAPPVESPEEVEAPPEPAVKPSLRERLSKSRNFIRGRLADALGQTPDEDTWEDVEAALISRTSAWPRQPRSSRISESRHARVGSRAPTSS